MLSRWQGQVLLPSRVGIGVSPKSRGGSIDGLLHSGTGAKQSRAECWCGDLSTSFGFHRTRSGERTSSSSEPEALLARRDSAWDGASCPKQTPRPLLGQPLPHLSVSIKIAFGGLFNLGSLRLVVKLARRGRECCA